MILKPFEVNFCQHTLSYQSCINETREKKLAHIANEKETQEEQKKNDYKMNANQREEILCVYTIHREKKGPKNEMKNTK